MKEEKHDRPSQARFDYKTKRKNQLMKIDRIKNSIDEDYLDLYSELKAYRRRANGLI